MDFYHHFSLNCGKHVYLYNHPEVGKLQRTPENGNDIEISSIYLRITIDLPSGNKKL